MSRAIALDSANADTRDRMTVAALAVFAEQGFDGATTREIAARAGVNLGLIQYYFGGKDRLWKAAVDLAFARLRDGLDSVLDDPSIADDDERTRRLVRGYVRFVARNREFVLLMHDEGRRPGPRMRWLVDRHVRPIYESMGVLLGNARRRGIVPDDVDLIHLHYILAGSVGLIFHQAAECRRLTGRDPAEPDMVEAHARAVEYVLLGPPTPADEESRT